MADPETIATGIDAYKHYIGGLAGTLTTICFLPQVWQIIKSRDTKAISLHMYILFTIGVSCWLLYGILLGSWPMMITNTISVTLAAVILTMKVRYG